MAMDVPRFDGIEDPIADDWWSYRDENGETKRSRITIGRPKLAEGGDYVCPIRINEFIDGVRCVWAWGPSIPS
jgi:hypothetical protein